jgi:hypothetical protein
MIPKSEYRFSEKIMLESKSFLARELQRNRNRGFARVR